MLIKTQQLTVLCILLVAAISLHSCKTEVDELISGPEIHLNIDPNDLPPISKLSQIATSVRIIPLETRPDCLVGSVGRTYVGENDIILVGHNDPSQLMHFTSDGKFLNFIGQEGQGPGEYRNVWDLTPFEDSSIVYVTMQHSRRMIAYTFDGEFLYEESFRKPLTNPKKLDKQRVAVMAYDYEVRIINQELEDTIKYIKTSQATTSQIRQLVGNQQIGYYYTALGRDTIWRIDQDSMRPQIICDFGTGHFSSQEYFASIMRPGGYPSGHLSIGGGAFNGSGYFHFSLLREVEEDYTYAHVVLHEKTHETWHLEQSPRSDDILFCTSTDFRTAAHSGEWVSVVGAYELIDALPDIEANQAHFNYPPGLTEQIRKLDIEQNPVLVLYELK